jgi:hypothetical protein
VTVWGGLISSQTAIEGLQISSPPPPQKKSLKQMEKLIFFSTCLLSLNLYEIFMGIAVLYFASLCMFLKRFFEVLKINFVTKSDKVQIYRKYQITYFLHKARSKEKNILRRVCF